MTSNFNPMIPFARPSLPGFGSLDRLLFGDNSFLTPVRKSENDDETKWDFNLAGYSASEIKVQVDAARHELYVRADRSAAGDERHFATKISLPLRATHEDVFSSYENGMLSVIVKEPVKKAEDGLVDIAIIDTPAPIYKDEESEKNTAASEVHTVEVGESNKITADANDVSETQ